MNTLFPVGIVVAAVLGLWLASRLSQAGRIALALRGLTGGDARVEIYGMELPGPLRVESVTALGAGLLVHLTPPGGKRTLLKIAQPSPARAEGPRIVIASARYVQWAGRRVSEAREAPAAVFEEATRGPRDPLA
ncbi:MAG: hypothetical protein ACJ79C_13820 [Myxococcales bacterium]